MAPHTSNVVVMLSFLLLSLSLSPAVYARNNLCDDTTDTNNYIKNGGFEDDADLVQAALAGTEREGMYLYMEPSDWTRTGWNIIALNGNAPWGGLSSQVGSYFCVLQRSFASIEQTVTGLKKDREYELSFLAAARPRYGYAEKLSVYVNNKEVLAENEPFEGFRREKVVVQADSNGEMKIKFQNLSPPGLDSSVFIDDIQLRIQRDCGEGAICMVENEQSTDYMCSCALEEYTGTATTNTKASCTHVVNTLEDVKKSVGVVDKKVDSVTDLLEKGIAVVDARQNETSQALLDKITSLENKLQKLMDNDLDDLDKRIKNNLNQINKNVGDIKKAQDTADDNTKTLTNLKQALKKALVDIKDVSSGRNPNFEPEFVGADGTVKITVANKAHVQVNEENILVEPEIQDMVKTSIEGILRDISDAM
eukprot:m.334009 g.334009  ORF g.334009 m.334009 type:complete len:422 (-) comp17268_c0_seq1:72-1337(-)